MQWLRLRSPRRDRKLTRAAVPSVEGVEERVLMAAPSSSPAVPAQAVSAAATTPGIGGYDPGNPGDLLTADEVQALLQRAAASVNRNDAIIVVVDRNGTILGVR